MKVCIDCFSMLQSNQRGVLEQDSSCRKSGETVSGSFLLQTFADKQKIGGDVVNVKASNGGRTQPSVGSADVNTVIPNVRSHVEELLRNSEILRRENDALLKHVSKQETQIRALSLERDRAIAQTALNEKHTCDKHEQQYQQQQPMSDTEKRELREQVTFCYRRIEAMEKELQKAVDRAQATEEEACHLRQRLFGYEGNKDHSLSSPRTPVTARANGFMGKIARRSLPTSIVWDTKLTPVAPKPCSALGPEINLWDWGFDTFEVATRVPSVLQTVAWEVASRWEFFTSEAEAQKWATLVATMEDNYRQNPYHNAIHAADVLQGVFALVTAVQPLMRHLTLVERKAVAFAALAHDVRHPGRTNAFLAALHDPVSFRFGGYGTLEKLHLETAFELLAVPELDFTSTMDNGSFLVFRNIVTRLIEHTDMTLHDACMKRWGAKIIAGGFDCTRADDRLEALTLILHAADIGASSRGVDIAKKWLVILEEFAEQAKEERRRGLPVTPGFDYPSSVGGSQIPFLDLFVIPIFDLLHQLFSEIEKPLQNLFALRERYAAEAGVTTSFPSPVDYRGSDLRLRELESQLAEYRSREGNFQRYLEDVKAVGSKLKLRSAELKAKEELVNERLRLIQGEEGRLRAEFSKMEKVMQESKECIKGREVSFRRLADETAGDGVDDAARLQGGTDANHGAGSRERSICSREGAVEENEKSIANREKRLAAYSEKLLDIAEKLHEERKHIGRAKEREASLPQCESALKMRETVACDSGLYALTRQEADERLARKFGEVDELLLIIRSMRRECSAIHGNETRRQALFATLAEREAAIAEAVELSRQRRRQADEGRVGRSAATQLDRLENAIYQLTAAITLLAE